MRGSYSYGKLFFAVIKGLAPPSPPPPLPPSPPIKINQNFDSFWQPQHNTLFIHGFVNLLQFKRSIDYLFTVIKTKIRCY